MKTLFYNILIVSVFVSLIFLLSDSMPMSMSTSDSDNTTIKYVGRERLKSNLRDPNSLDIIEEEIIMDENGNPIYRAKYRAKNGFGGYNVEEFYTK